MNHKISQPQMKLNYFHCKKGDLHEGQVLNYVCIQKFCNQKGLLCSVCKADHNNHNVVPLKYFLNAVKSDQKDQPSSESFQSQIEELERLKSSFLYELKVAVDKFAEGIQEVEQKIVETFKNIKIELMNQIEMSLKFNQIIQATINNEVQDQETFEKDFKTLAALVQNVKKVQNGKSIDNFSFSVNLKKTISDYEDSYKSYSQKLDIFVQSSKLFMSGLLSPFKVSSPQQLKPKLVVQNLKQNYQFSTFNKASNVKISNGNLSAECLSTSSQRFSIIDGQVQKKGSSIRFRIDKLKNWIGIGLGIRNNIVGKNYHFLYNAAGHGSFLLSSNGYSWSHSNVSNNLVLSNFPFVQGNIIKVETHQFQLIYTNQTQQNKIYKLPIQLNETQWNEACFCVNLTSPEDKVSIV